jgi:hypothetical protein
MRLKEITDKYYDINCVTIGEAGRQSDLHLLIYGYKPLKGPRRLILTKRSIFWHMWR